MTAEKFKKLAPASGPVVLRTYIGVSDRPQVHEWPGAVEI